jgi:predicted TIM-barrel fold metal-dependent hydrolase
MSGLQRIDVHHHIYPPRYIAEEGDRIVSIAPGFPAAILTEWTAEKTLDDMDRNDIQASIVSISTPGVWFGNVEKGRKLARICNDFAAELILQYPKRFGMFGVIPLPDVEGSLREIEYCFEQLKFDGIGILTSYGKRWPGDAAFAPVFEELNRRKSVIHFHPTAPAEFMSLVPDVPPAIAEFPFDTTRSIMSLLFSGTLSCNQNIRCIFSHGGGTVPYLADRIASLARRPTATHLAARMPNGVEHELRKLYFDVVSVAGNRHGMAALRSFADPDHLLLGSDFPYASVDRALQGLKKLDLSPDETAKIERDNALTLFPELAKRL